ncbi:PorP/SprF family type IX secretion system membrane protein [Flavobacterium weaverense]|uniref:Type IX secretion system PorP/SprF family membrane protein n=2 Tax=Flavobacterium weaverense TaxID=271156 RepID=A0A3L9ZX83_9FLAO|nr:PorP/SprF family type IX secretion system membrane protein [Flavobacterium weaverense]RMA76987.1 type IX secretion system PorP/SprF family membrane protein [Flavobacterium weaverense]
MRNFLITLVILCSIQLSYSQEDGVVSIKLPVRNSLKFNKFLIDPTFSFVKEQSTSISIYGKKQWAQFDNAPQTYLFSYAGRITQNQGVALGLFQQNHGVLTKFGGIANFAQNIELGLDSNLTFGLNLGFYKSGLNRGEVITNFPDPSLDNIPSNFLFSLKPGINYGTNFIDFGVSINNLLLYNLKTSKMIEDDPEKSIELHAMYTGYLESYGFFDKSKFSTLIKTDLKKEKTVVSGLVLFAIPSGVWVQGGYNTLYGISAGLGLNITARISVEYNYEKATGNFSNFGPSHEITLAYRFKRNKNYAEYDDEEGSIINPSEIKKYVPSENAATTTKANSAKLAAETKAASNAKMKAEPDTKAKLTSETKAKEAAIAGAKAAADLKLKAGADAKAKLEAETKDKETALAQTKAADDAKMKANADAKAKLAAETKAKEAALARAKAAADAKMKADAYAKAKLAAETKAKEAALAQAKAAEDAKIKSEADAKAKLAAETKAKEATLAQAKAANDAKIKSEAHTKARLAAETKAKEAALAQAKAAEDAKIKSEADAKAKLAIETKVKEDELALATANATKDDNAKSMRDLTQVVELSRNNQEKLLKKLDATVLEREKDLNDLKEENDLREKGIFKEPKPFKSISAQNSEFLLLKSEIEVLNKSQNSKIQALESLYKERIKKGNKKEDITAQYYLKTIQTLKSEQAEVAKINTNLLCSMDKINEETEIAKKRRIKLASFENDESRHISDLATLKRIKETTQLSTEVFKPTDFDYGDVQSNIQIVKNVKNVPGGYYLVVAVHDDVAKRDEFLKKAVAAGEKNINFFYDVNTSKYFIYYNKFDSINQAKQAQESKGSKPYNGKMTLVRVEN